jgi:hypothetical protein
VPKGANTGDFLKDDATWAAAPSSAIVRDGGKVTEASTNGTSYSDELVSTTMSIAIISPFIVIYSARKSAGAYYARTSHKANSTALADGEGQITGWYTKEVDRAEDGMCHLWCASRVDGSYSGGIGLSFQNTITGTGVKAEDQSGVDSNSMCADNDMVTDIVTSWTIRGQVTNAAITCYMDALHVYEYSTG